MTDWERYDVDDKLARTSETHRVEDLSARHRTNIIVQDPVLIALNAHRVAEALKAMDAVEALKARGILKNRRRRDGGEVGAAPTLLSSAPLDSNPLADTTNLPQEGGDSSVMLRLAQAISTVSASLVELAAETEALARISSAPGNQQRRQGVSAGMDIMYKIESFRRDTFLPALALNIRAQELEFKEPRGNSGLGTSSYILAKVDGALDGLLKQVSFHLALCAVAVGEYALAADMARYRLKLELPGSLSSNSALAPVWMVRALAFAGMGCAYLANTHCQKVKQCSSSYPEIDALLTYLDSYEDSQVRFSLRSHFQDLRRRVQAQGKNYVFNVTNIFDARVETLATLLPISPSLGLDEAGGEEGENWDLSDVLGRVWEETNVDAAGMDMVRLLFYEAQILYLESMFLSAEMKYYDVILLAHAFLNSSLLTIQADIARAVLSASYLNAAICRVNRDKAREPFYNDSKHALAVANNIPAPQVPLDPPPPPRHAGELLSWSCVELGSMALGLRESLPGRIRFSFVLEVMHRYSDALALLEFCNDDALSLGPFVSAGTGPNFSQLLLCGSRIMPFSTVADDLSLEEMRTVVKERRERIVYLQSRFGV